MKSPSPSTAPRNRAYFIAGVLILAFIPRGLPAQDQPEKKNEIIYNEVVELIGQLTSQSDKEKIKAANKLGKIRAAYSVAALKEALKDPSIQVRLAIVDALGQIATAASAKALAKEARDDASEEVQVAAVEALSALQVEASYQGCVSLVQSSKKEKTKQAALDCIRKWNQSHAALTKPIALPKGKKEPRLAKPKQAQEEPPPQEMETGKKKKKKKKEPEKGSFFEGSLGPQVKPKSLTILVDYPGTKGKELSIKEIKEEESQPEGLQIKEIIDEYPMDEPTLPPPAFSEKEKIEFPDEEAFVTLHASSQDVLRCLAGSGKHGRALKVKILITPGGHMGRLYVLTDTNVEEQRCIKTVISQLEFPPFKSSYIVSHEFKSEQYTTDEILPSGLLKEAEIYPQPGKKKHDFLTVDISSLGKQPLLGTSFAVPTSKGGLAFILTGEYVFRKIFGLGLELNAGSGISVDYEGQGGVEEALFGNLGIFARLAGEKKFEKIHIRYGGKLSIYLPTASKGSYEYDVGEQVFMAENRLRANVYASKIDYYRIERYYPNINSSSAFFLRPDFGFALGTDRFLLQLELGFDFLLLTDATYEDEYGDGYSTGSTNMVMIHIGAGMYFFPIEFLQASIELTWINPVHGRLYENPESPSTSLRAPGGELCITPAVTFFIPLPRGNAFVGIGARVPTGDINSTLGSFTWIANAGWRW